MKLPLHEEKQIKEKLIDLYEKLGRFKEKEAMEKNIEDYIEK